MKKTCLVIATLFISSICLAAVEPQSTGIASPWGSDKILINPAALSSSAQNSAVLDARYTAFLNSMNPSFSYFRGGRSLGWGVSVSSAVLERGYGVAGGAGFSLGMLSVGAGARAQKSLDGSSVSGQVGARLDLLGLELAVAGQDLGATSGAAVVGAALNLGWLRPELDISYGFSSARVGLRPALGVSIKNWLAITGAYNLPQVSPTKGSIDAFALFALGNSWEAQLRFESALTTMGFGLAYRL